MLILPDAPWRAARDAWRRVDELGFAHAWTYDHIAWRDLVGQRWYAAVPTLTAAAAYTSRIGLGALVFSPNFRHPVPLVKEAVTLSEISAGRFQLALGAGATGPDAAVLGRPAWSPGERRERFAEFVTLTDRLLREPRTDHTGRFYSARGVVDPDAGARARIPLLVAGNGGAALSLAARYADGWITNGASPQPRQVPPEATPELVRDQLARLAAACGEQGRDPATLRTLLLDVNRRRPALASFDAFVDAVGSYRDAGITDLVVPFPRSRPPFVADPALLERIAAEVLPGLRPAEEARSGGCAG